MEAASVAAGVGVASVGAAIVGAASVGLVKSHVTYLAFEPLFRSENRWWVKIVQSTASVSYNLMRGSS